MFTAWDDWLKPAPEARPRTYPVEKAEYHTRLLHTGQDGAKSLPVPGEEEESDMI